MTRVIAAEQPSPAQLSAGASELIEVCLAATAADTILVLTDAATAELAAHIQRAGERIARCTAVVLPDLNDDYPAAFSRISAELARIRPSVVVFAARDDEDLLAWDERYWAQLAELGARNAQMPALDAASLGVGMAANYREVARFTERVTERVSGIARLAVSNELGTDIVFACDPERPWTPFTGLYRGAGEGGRLPQGETFCSPLSADGTIAASVIGYPFNASTGLLVQPARFEIGDGRLTAVHHPDAGLEQRLRAWFTRDPHAGRIGELALGTNRFCTDIVGNLLFDENVPGCHIALGHPFGDYTGAEWTSGVHVDLVVAKPTITVDGIALIRDGRYLDDALIPQNGARP